MQILNRTKYVMTGEDGTSNLEIIVWMFVVLMIFIFLFFLRSKISDLILSSKSEVEQIEYIVDYNFSIGNSEFPIPET